MDPTDRPITLHGCNLGNWLLLEMWMLDLHGLTDQHAFEASLTERFGEAKREAWLEAYRSNFITSRDFEIIRSFGFNCVRLPFEYRLLSDDRDPFALRPDAFRWLDRAMEMAERAGLYLILDLHGTPGRQSVDHTTGHAGRNQLWSDPQAQDRTAWLWKEIAARYRDSTVVAGYDLINEPFGDYRTAEHLPALSDLMDRLYRTVRSVDDRHVIFVAGAQQGLAHYGDPAARGWTNVAFTEHYYPGLFGSAPTLATHGRFLGQRIPVRAFQLDEMRVPLLVGEFNVVHRHLGAPALMRRYFDTYAARGWAATMWSYKLLRKSGGTDGDFWGLVANRDPLPPRDPRTASFEELMAFAESLGTMPLAVYDELRTNLLASAAPAIELPVYPLLRDPPARDVVPGWRTEDIGGARAGGQRRLAGGGLEVYGGGNDIWNERDQFRFIAQEATGDLRLTARLDSLADTGPHAKAGLMVRRDLEPDSPHLLLHAFPDGRLLMGWRSTQGERMAEREVARGRWPAHLSLERRQGVWRIGFSANGESWRYLPVDPAVDLPEHVHAGLAVMANAENQLLTTARFASFDLRR